MSEEPTQPRLVIYDGDCPVCRAAAERLRKRTWATPHRVVAFQDLEPDLAERMTEAGIDRQMLVHDPESDEVTGGFKALREVEAASGHTTRAAILSTPGIAQLGALVYRLFAVNRRLFSPIPSGIDCACDPDPRVWERGLMWILLLLPIAGLGLVTGQPIRTIYFAFCLLWMVPTLAGLVVDGGPGRIAGQLGVSLSLAAAAGLVVWGTTWLVTPVLPRPAQMRLILLAMMWIVGSWMLFRRLRTIGVGRLYWLWQAVTLMAVAIVALSPTPEEF